MGLSSCPPVLEESSQVCLDGSLGCLQWSIISPASHNPKMSQPHSTELREPHRYSQTSPPTAPTLIPHWKTLQLHSLGSLTLADIKIGIMRKCRKSGHILRKREGEKEGEKGQESLNLVINKKISPPETAQALGKGAN